MIVLGLAHATMATRTLRLPKICLALVSGHCVAALSRVEGMREPDQNLPVFLAHGPEPESTD
jgi:hypothetical protein